MAKQNLLVTTWQTEHHSACFDAGQDKRKKEKKRKKKGLAGGNLSATSVLLHVLGPRSSMCYYQGVAHTPTMTDVLAVKGTVDLFG